MIIIFVSTLLYILSAFAYASSDPTFHVSDSINTLAPLEDEIVESEIPGGVKRDLQNNVVAYWRVFEWGGCSVECGGGFQTRLVICWANLTDSETDQALCSLQRPARTRECNEFLCPSVDVTEFSCDPYAINARNRCPAEHIGGGRLFFNVLEAINLPASESYSVSKDIDPYVVVRIGKVERTTFVVENNGAHPVWQKPSDDSSISYLERNGLFFGIQDSASEVVIEIWDRDSGLEGSDDLLGTIRTSVIACSPFLETCNERTWLPLKEGDDCFLTVDDFRNATLVRSNATCIRVQQFMTPFNVTLAVNGEDGSSSSNTINWPMELSIANSYNALTDSSDLVGTIYRNQSVRIDPDYVQFAHAKGGLILRSFMDADRLLNVSYANTFRVNFACNVFVFRYIVDDRFFTSLPRWLSKSNGWVLYNGTQQHSARPVGLTFPQYRAHVRHVAAHSTFTLGSPLDVDPINLGSASNDYWSFVNLTSTRMYFVVIRWDVDQPTNPTDRSRHHDLGYDFWTLVPVLMIPQLIAILLLWPFLRNIHFRWDLIEPYLASRVLPVPTRSPDLPAVLEMSDGLGFNESQLSGSPTSSSPTKSVGSQVPLTPAHSDMHLTPAALEAQRRAFTQALLPDAPEHILASVFLTHPDFVKAENSMRVVLAEDVISFESQQRSRSLVTPRSGGLFSSNSRSRWGMFGTPRSPRAHSVPVTPKAFDDVLIPVNTAVADNRLQSSMPVHSQTQGSAQDRGKGPSLVLPGTLEKQSSYRSSSMAPQRAASVKELARALSLSRIQDEGEDIEELRAFDPLALENSAAQLHSVEPRHMRSLSVNGNSSVTGGRSDVAANLERATAVSFGATQHPLVRVYSRAQFAAAIGDESQAGNQGASNVSSSLHLGRLGSRDSGTPRAPSPATSHASNGSVMDSASINGNGKISGGKRLHVPRLLLAETSPTSFHRALFWTATLVKTLMLLPPLLSVAHGVLLLDLVKPQAMGIGLILLGPSGYYALYAMCQWICGNYRPSRTLQRSWSLLLLCFFAFAVATVYSDPAAAVLRLPEMTALAAGVSFFPMVLLLFVLSPSLADARAGLAALVPLAAHSLHPATSSGANPADAPDARAASAAAVVSTALSAPWDPQTTGPASGASPSSAGRIRPSTAVPSRANNARHESLRALAASMGVPSVLAEVFSQTLAYGPLFMKERARVGVRTAKSSNASGGSNAGGAAKGRGSVQGRTPQVTAFASEGYEPVSGPARSEFASLPVQSQSTGKTVLQSHPTSDSVSSNKDMKSREKDKGVEKRMNMDESDSDGSQDGSPMPASDFNFSGVSLGVTEAEEFILRAAAVAAAPWLQVTPGKRAPINFPRGTLTNIMGEVAPAAAFSIPHAAPSHELSFAEGVLGLVFPSVEAVPRVARSCFWLAALCHLGHAAAVLARTNGNTEGLADAASLLVIDFVMYRLAIAQRVQWDPLLSSALLLVSRILLSVCSGHAWLAGASLAYLPLALALAVDVGLHSLPEISDAAAEAVLLLGLIDAGRTYAQIVRQRLKDAARMQARLAKCCGSRRPQKKPRSEDTEEDEKDKHDKVESSMDKEKSTGKSDKDKAAMKTPLAGRYAGVGGVPNTPATTGAATPSGFHEDGGTNKVSRNAGTKAIQNKSSRGRSSSGGAKSGPSSGRDSSNGSVPEGKNSRKRKSLAEMAAELDKGGDKPSTSVSPTSGSSTGSARLSAQTAAARRMKPRHRGTLLQQLILIEDSWSALSVLTISLLGALIPSLIYYRVRASQAASSSTLNAGLWDSSDTWTEPTVWFFGVDGGVRTWIVGLVVLVIVFNILFLVFAADARRRLVDGLLPSVFDVPLPWLVKGGSELRRLSLPWALFLFGELISGAFGVLMVSLTKSWSSLVLLVACPPALMCGGIFLRNYMSNGWSFMEPSRRRIPMDATELLRLNAIAGYPLASLRFRKQWAAGMSVTEKVILNQLEFGDSIAILEEERARAEAEAAEVAVHPVSNGNRINSAAQSQVAMANLKKKKAVQALLSKGPRSIFDLPAIRGEHYVLGQEVRELLRQQAGLDVDDPSGPHDDGSNNLTAPPLTHTQLHSNQASATDRSASSGVSKDGILEESTAQTPSDRDKAARDQGAADLIRQRQLRSRGCGAALLRLYFRYKMQRIDVANLSFVQAFISGRLTSQDYSTLLAAGGFLVILIGTGIVLDLISGAHSLSHALWAIPLVIMTGLGPLVGAPGARKADLARALLVALAGTGVIGYIVLKEMNEISPLVPTLAKPVFAAATTGFWGLVLAAISWRIWAARGFRLSLLVLLLEAMLLVAAVGIAVVIYAWGSQASGLAAAFAFGCAFLGRYGIAAQRQHEGALPARTNRVLLLLALIAYLSVLLAAVFSNASYTYLSLHIFGAPAMLLFVRAWLRVRALGPAPLSFGPTLLPVLSLHPETGSLRVERQLGYDLLFGFMLLVVSATSLLTFSDPPVVGLLALLVALAAPLAFSARAAIHMPLRLGALAAFVDADALRGATALALDSIIAQRASTPLSLLPNTSDGVALEEVFADAPLDSVTATPTATFGLPLPSVNDGPSRRSSNFAVNVPKQKLAAPSPNPSGNTSNGELDAIAARVRQTLSFLDPSARVYSLYEDPASSSNASNGASSVSGTAVSLSSAVDTSLSFPLAKLRALRQGRSAAHTMAELALLNWSLDNAWPWQLGEADFTQENLILLLQRLRLSDKQFRLAYRELSRPSVKHCLSPGREPTNRAIDEAMDGLIFRRAWAVMRALGRTSNISDPDLLSMHLLRNELQNEPLARETSDFVASVLGFARSRQLPLPSARDLATRLPIFAILQASKAYTAHAMAVANVRAIPRQYNAKDREREERREQARERERELQRERDALENAGKEMKDAQMRAFRQPIPGVPYGYSHFSRWYRFGARGKRTFRLFLDGLKDSILDLLNPYAVPKVTFDPSRTVNFTLPPEVAANFISGPQLTPAAAAAVAATNINAAVGGITQDGRPSSTTGPASTPNGTGEYEINTDSPSSAAAIAAAASNAAVAATLPLPSSTDVYPVAAAQQLLGGLPLSPNLGTPAHRSGHTVAAPTAARAATLSQLLPHSFSLVSKLSRSVAPLVHPLYAPVLRHDRPWGFSEALADSILFGDSPLGIIVGYGLFYHIYLVLKAIGHWLYSRLVCWSTDVEFDPSTATQRKKVVSRYNVYGLCCRRQPHALPAAVPSDDEIERLAHDWSVHSHIKVVISRTGDPKLHPRNFPSIVSSLASFSSVKANEAVLNANVTSGVKNDVLSAGLFSSDGKPLSQGSEDHHGLVSTARNTLFGLLTVGVGWMPASLPTTVLNAIFGPVDAVGDYEFSMEDLRTILSSNGVQGSPDFELQPLNSNGTGYKGDSSSNLENSASSSSGLEGEDVVDVSSDEEESSKPHTPSGKVTLSSRSMSKSPFSFRRPPSPPVVVRRGPAVQAGAPVVLRVSIDPRTRTRTINIDVAHAFALGLQQPESRCVPPPAHVALYARIMEANRTLNAEWMEETHAQQHIQGLLVASADSKRRAARAQFPYFWASLSERLSSSSHAHNNNGDENSSSSSSGDGKNSGTAPATMTVTLPPQLKTPGGAMASVPDLRVAAGWLLSLDDRAALTYTRAREALDARARSYRTSQMAAFCSIVAARMMRQREMAPRSQAIVAAHQARVRTVERMLRQQVEQKLQAVLQEADSKAPHQMVEVKAVDARGCCEPVVELDPPTDPQRRRVLNAIASLKLENPLIDGSLPVAPTSAPPALSKMDTSTGSNVSELQVSLDPNEDTTAKVLVHAIENGYLDCSTLAGGRFRPQQFIDPEFPPVASSIGELQPPVLHTLLAPAWSIAPAVNPLHRLFLDGSDPADVMVGFAVRDSWLLTAVAMLANANWVSRSDQKANRVSNLLSAAQALLESGAMPGASSGTPAASTSKVVVSSTVEEEQALPSRAPALPATALAGPVGARTLHRRIAPFLDNIFITKRRTATGAYALRLCVSGYWVTLLVDDALPTLSAETAPVWAPRVPLSRGLAAAHSPEAAELWVSILEKAVAKLHGSYGALRGGALENALSVLTGAETARTPLHIVSESLFRARVWGQLRAACAAGFIVGAETFGASSAGGAPGGGQDQRDLLPSGLWPGAVYTISALVQVDDTWLLRLRDPPGLTSAWAGRFSAGSREWTHKRASLARWDPERDRRSGHFWMDFDDFFGCFQSLYVCRSVDRRLWHRLEVGGAWFGQQAAGLVRPNGAPADRHLNPQYSLEVTTPTTFIMTLSQVPFVPEIVNRSGTGGIGACLNGGLSGAELRDDQVLPISLFVVNTAGLDSVRLDRLTYVAASIAEEARTRAEMRSLLNRGASAAAAPPSLPTSPVASQAQGGLKGKNSRSVSFIKVDEANSILTDSNTTTNAASTLTSTAGASFVAEPNSVVGINSLSEKVFPVDSDGSFSIPTSSNSKLYPTENAGNSNGSGGLRINPSLPPLQLTSNLSMTPSASQVPNQGAAAPRHVLNMQPLTGAPLPSAHETLHPFLAQQLIAATHAADAVDPQADRPFIPRSDGRVYALPASSIAACTGAPARERSIRLTCTLQPGTYTILAAAEQPGMQGAFALVLEASRPAELRQLWPPRFTAQDEAVYETAASRMGGLRSRGSAFFNRFRASTPSINPHAAALSPTAANAEVFKSLFSESGPLTSAPLSARNASDSGAMVAALRSSEVMALHSTAEAHILKMHATRGPVVARSRPMAPVVKDAPPPSPPGSQTNGKKTAKVSPEDHAVTSDSGSSPSSKKSSLLGLLLAFFSNMFERIAQLWSDFETWLGLLFLTLSWKLGLIDNGSHAVIFAYKRLEVERALSDHMVCKVAVQHAQEFAKAAAGSAPQLATREQGEEGPSDGIAALSAAVGSSFDLPCFHPLNDDEPDPFAVPPTSRKPVPNVNQNPNNNSTYS